MKLRKLGTNGPAVGAIGLGCMGMSFAYGERDEASSTDTLLRALDLGVTHFDTSDFYGFGHNEELIGRVLKGRRDEFVLATKFAIRKGDDGNAYADSSPEWARQACDLSLQRLGMDTIDLYYMHRRTASVPIEDTVGAMASLREQGKIRHLGLSEVNPTTLRKAHAVHPIAAVQMEYSLFTRGVEDEMLATCRELGVALVAYSPVTRGLLTGTVSSRDELVATDARHAHPRFADENLAANLRLVEAVKAVAAEIGCTPAQAAIAWVLAQGDDVLPIPGTKRVSYLEQNVAADDIVLTPSQLAALAAAVPAASVAGWRYPEASRHTVEL